MKKKKFILVSLAVASVLFVFTLLRSYLRADRNRPPVETGSQGQDVCGARREFFTGARHTYINLRNVKFHWTGDYFIRTEDADIKVAPRGGDRVFNLDDSSSYVLEIIRGAVTAELPVLEKLFNERTLNYPGAALKNIRLTAEGPQGDKRIVLRGEMRFGAWIGFTVRARLSVDRAANRIIVKSESISALGLPFAKGIIDLSGLTLEKLVSIRGDRGIAIAGNDLVIDPFVLFPPPVYSGCLDGVAVSDSGLALTFRTVENFSFPARPQGARNDVFLVGGVVKLATMRLVFSRTQIVDSVPGDDFEFNINDYFRQISRSSTRITGDGSVVVTMPDYFKTAAR
jgi:hypothetical protein